MNYSDALSQARPMMDRGETVTLPFNLDCKLGKLYQGQLTFRVVQMSLGSTTIEILDFKTGDQNQEDHGSTDSRPYIIPVPS